MPTGERHENEGPGSDYPSQTDEVAKKFPDRKESSQILENSEFLSRRDAYEDDAMARSFAAVMLLRHGGDGPRPAR